MKPIQVRTEPPKDYQEVVHFIDVVERQYGEIQEGPYILRSEFDALQRYAERTDTDRVEFVNELGCRIIYVAELQGWVCYNSDMGHIFVSKTNFDSWREAVDALMDMEEQV